MKNILLTLIILALGIGIGVYVGKQENLPNRLTMINQDKKSSSVNDNKNPLYWVGPMDPNYRSDKPGKTATLRKTYRRHGRCAAARRRHRPSAAPYAPARA